MAVSPAEIRNRALRRLGVIGWGETPDSTIADDMDQAYAEVFAHLEEANVSVWAIAADVPNGIVRPLVNLCALARSVEHKISELRLSKIISEAGPNGDKAVNKIRARTRDAHQPTESVEYF